MNLERLKQIISDPNIALTRAESKQIEEDMYREFNSNKEFNKYATHIAKSKEQGNAAMVDSDTIIKAYISCVTQDEDYKKFLEETKKKETPKALVKVAKTETSKTETITHEVEEDEEATKEDVQEVQNEMSTQLSKPNIVSAKKTKKEPELEGQLTLF